MRDSRYISIILAFGLILMLNLSSASDYAFGTKVAPYDSDLGRLLKSIPDSTIIGFWDIGPNVGIYDGDDVVYLDMPPTGSANANDIRLTPFGKWPAGTKVTPHDNDVDSPLKPMSAEIRFLNLNGSQSYDYDDPVYVHQSNLLNSGDATGVIGANEPINYPATTDSSIASPTTAANIAATNATIPAGNPATNIGDEENTNDMIKDNAHIAEGFSERLSYTGYCNNLPQGTTCLIFSDNFIWPVSDYCIDNTPYLVGFDNNGLPIEGIHCNSAEYYHILGTLFVKSVPRQKTLFIQSASAQEDLIRTNDIRLTPIGWLAAGTRVQNFEPDLNKLIALPVLVSFTRKSDDYGGIRVYDANGNGLYDAPDDVYLDISFPGYSSFGTVSVNDVRLSGSDYHCTACEAEE